MTRELLRLFRYKLYIKELLIAKHMKYEYNIIKNIAQKDEEPQLTVSKYLTKYLNNMTPQDYMLKPHLHEMFTSYNITKDIK